MKIKKIIINNYRSIEHLEFTFDPIAGKNCHIFFGVNEAGKSSILKSINLVNDYKDFNYKQDCFKPAQDKHLKTTVDYELSIPQIQSDAVINSLKNKEILPEDLCNQIRIKDVIRNIAFDKSNDAEFSYTLYFDKGIKIKDFLYSESLNVVIRAEDFDRETQDRNNFCELNNKILSDFISQKKKILLNVFFPKIILWAPILEEHLITTVDDLMAFDADRKSSLPLKNIFKLCGYVEEDVTQLIEDLNDDPQIRAEKSEEFSRVVSMHLNNIWPDHDVSVDINFEPNACHVNVLDAESTKRFSMEQRSDGFKRFVSLLLTLSVDMATDTLSNNFILLDEPEISLHPSSVKHLRDELLKISKSNVVLAASHSTFMVDKESLNRHYTVRRINNHTEVEQIDKDNPLKEEVIYESLGTSIYEVLSPNIVVFEGRTDKDVFDAVTEKLKSEIKPVDYQSISVDGADNMPKYAKFFHGLIKGWFIVDSDKAGRLAMNTILKNDPEFNNRVFELSNVVTITKKNFTLEDVFPLEIVLDEALSMFNFDFSGVRKTNPIMDEIREIKNKNAIRLDAKHEELKKAIIGNMLTVVKKSTIKDLKLKCPFLVEMVINTHTKIKENN